MVCPAHDCKASNPPQRDLTPGERAEMGNPDWGERAMRCSYCGCVYARAEHGRGAIKGWYDNAMLGRGWRPVRHA